MVQCGAVHDSVMQCGEVYCIVMQFAALWCIVLQCVVPCGAVWLRVGVWCRVVTSGAVWY